VFARAADAGRNSFGELTSPPCRNDVDALRSGIGRPFGRAAVVNVTGAETDWKFKKGAIWWFERSEDEKGASAAARAVISPAFL